jgi:hypothetical protein
MQRNGMLEDTFWNCVSLPISGIHGDIIGLFLEFTEMTRLIVGERRRESMMKLGQNIGPADSLDTLFNCYLKGSKQSLEHNTDLRHLLIILYNFSGGRHK